MNWNITVTGTSFEDVIGTYLDIRSGICVPDVPFDDRAAKAAEAAERVGTTDTQQ